MTDQGADRTPGGEDLEYDLVHEADHEQTEGSPADIEHGDRPGAYVATVTPTYDGDYGYDMSHDIPRP